jgi:hypothetical protein
MFNFKIKDWLVKSSQVKSSQVKSSQVKSSQEKRKFQVCAVKPFMQFIPSFFTEFPRRFKRRFSCPLVI